MGFTGGSEDKESACSVRDPGLIPGLGRSHGPSSLVGYSPWGHKESDTTK